MAKRKVKFKAKKKPNPIIIGVVIFVGVVVLGVGVYFAAFYEPPPKPVVMRDMYIDFETKIRHRFDISNHEFQKAQSDLGIFVYNPKFYDEEGKMTQAYRKGDMRPVGDLGRTLHWDPGAMVFLGLPCDNVYDVFDNEHVDHPSNEKHAVKEACPHANQFYYSFGFPHPTGRTDSPLVFNCVRCGKRFDKLELKLMTGYSSEAELYNPDELFNPESRVALDIVQEDGEYGSEWVAAAKTIAGAYGVSEETQQTEVLPGLEFVWIKWPEKRERGEEEEDESWGEYEQWYDEKLAQWQADWEATPEEERIPLGYKGKIRFIEITRIFDEHPRVNRVKDNTLKRYDNIREPLIAEEDREFVADWYGYMVWRKNTIKIYEVDIEYYRGGNVMFKNWEEPRLLTVLEPFHRDPTLEEKNKERAAEVARKREEIRAKLAEAANEAEFEEEEIPE